MSAVTREQFDGRMTQSQLDTLVNSLLVPMVDFGFTSGLTHRMFGVITGSSDGERTYSSDPNESNRSDAQDRFLINPCLRFAYPKIAAKVQESIENELHWLTTERYVYDDIPLKTWYAAKLQTAYPGVEKMNVIPVWTSLEGYDRIPVTVFLENADIELNPYGDNTPAAIISSALSPNPNEMYLRDTATYIVHPWFSDGGHRIQRNTVDELWQLALNTKRQVYNNETLGVQSKRILQVKIPAPTLPVGATLYPVYPGTTQMIPQAQPMFVNEDDEWVYTFWIYTLVHPDFEAETVDLMSAGEFWKLYPYISFKYLTEEVAYPQVRVTRGDTVTLFTGLTDVEDVSYAGPTATLVGSEYGVFHLNYDTCSTVSQWSCLCNAKSWPENVMLRVYYKVNPDYLPAEMRDYRTSIHEAVSARIATELPLHNCKCNVEQIGGYIAQMHVLANGERIVTPNGAVIDKLRYGNLYGQVTAAEIMNAAPKYDQLLIV